MTRRIVWIGLLLAAALALGGAWFLGNYERVPVKERTEEEAEARRNPYLALERFLARMGRPLLRESNAMVLDALPAGGTLILDRDRRQHMQPARVERLLAWVEQGGYLILVPEARGVSDPLLERLDAGWFTPQERKAEDEPAADDDGETAAEPQAQPPAAPAAKPAPPPERILVALPGAPRPLTVRFRAPGLRAGATAPAWQSGAAGHGDLLLHYRRGQGSVTVAANLGWLMQNRRIGENDHAELLWTLIRSYQRDPAGRVVLAARLAVPDLWDWLAGPGSTALASAAALLGLWLWRTLPRFGPAVVEPAPNRRELREHLTALGRYVWRAGGLDHWLRVAREAFLAKLALRHPSVAALPPAEQAAALAHLTRRSQSLIAAALHGPTASPQSFTDALRTLHQLERTL